VLHGEEEIHVEQAAHVEVPEEDDNEEDNAEEEEEGA
jgi:hypothetical protein